MTRGAAGLVMLVLLARFVAGSSLTNEGAFLDGLEYLPPWTLSLLVVPLAGVLGASTATARSRLRHDIPRTGVC